MSNLPAKLSGPEVSVSSHTPHGKNLTVNPIPLLDTGSLMFWISC
jgi:hypothetical protein